MRRMLGGGAVQGKLSSVLPIPLTICTHKKCVKVNPQHKGQRSYDEEAVKLWRWTDPPSASSFLFGSCFGQVAEPL